MFFGTGNKCNWLYIALNSGHDIFKHIQEATERLLAKGSKGASSAKKNQLSIEAHEGTIKASSSSLGGVAIRIDLPLYDGRIKKVQNGKQQPHHPAG